MLTFATWRVSPRFDVAGAERLRASRQLLFLMGNLPCPRGATNRKTRNEPDIAPRADGFSGFVLHRSDQPLPKCRELRRIRSRLRRDKIEAGIGRQGDLERNH